MSRNAIYATREESGCFIVFSKTPSYVRFILKIIFPILLSLAIRNFKLIVYPIRYPLSPISVNQSVSQWYCSILGLFRQSLQEQIRRKWNQSGVVFHICSSSCNVREFKKNQSWQLNFLSFTKMLDSHLTFVDLRLIPVKTDYCAILTSTILLSL